jgi:DNA polymerase-3 subunit gamma/tau
LGEDVAFDFAPDQISRLRGLGEAFSAGQLTRAWQILMTAHGEVRRAPVPLAAAEMALLKLALAGQMPPPELAAQIIRQAQKMESEGGAGLPQLTSSAPEKSGSASAQRPTSSSASSSHGASPTPSQAASRSAPKPVAPSAPSLRLESFEDFVAHVDDLRLRHDLERYVSVVSFADGQAEIHITEARHNAIVGRMVRSLQELTGQQWLVSPAPSPGAPTLSDQRKAAKASQDADDRSHPAFAHPLLKDAKILEIKDRAPNVIAGNFKSPNGKKGDAT